MTVKEKLRCVCGLAVPRRQLVRGALGEHALQALTEAYVGRPYGTNGGAVIWTRRPMNREELELVGAACARAAENITARLGEEIVAAPPEEVLASLDDDEAAEVSLQWIEEAQAELERRRQIAAADLARRTFG